MSKTLGKYTFEEVIEECDKHRRCSSCPFSKLLQGKCVTNINKSLLNVKIELEENTKE